MENWIYQYFGEVFAPHFINAFVLVTATAVTGFLVKYFLQTFGSKLIRRTRTPLDDQVLAIIVPRVKWLTIIVAMDISVAEIAKGIHAADKTSHEIIKYLDQLIYIAFVVFSTNILIKLVDTVVKHTMERHARQAASSMDIAILPTLNRLVAVTLLIIALVITLGHFGVDVSSILVFLGGGSVAIALAAQETLSNMIAGFVIMIDRPFRVGDRIKLPSAETGDVSEIGLRSTKILDQDHNVIVVPNAELTKARVVNLSYPTPEVRLLIDISVAYGTKIDRAKSIMLECAAKHTEVLRVPPPEAVLVDLKESACHLQLTARIADWRKKNTVENILREQIYNTFQNENILAGFPQRIIHIAEKKDDNSKNS